MSATKISTIQTYSDPDPYVSKLLLTTMPNDLNYWHIIKTIVGGLSQKLYYE